jgi:hypothetical protein
MIKNAVCLQRVSYLQLTNENSNEMLEFLNEEIKEFKTNLLDE